MSVILYRTVIISMLLVTLTACGHKEKHTSTQPNNETKTIETMQQTKTNQVTTQENDTVINGWKLVWSDEFDSDDSTKWNSLNEGSKDHGRLQYYREENVDTENGELVLTLKKEDYNDFDYTSGAVTTEGKMSFQYGKLQIRAKLPDGYGVFPAIWMLPANKASYPEIDIAEMIGREPTELWNVLHWGVAEKKSYKMTDVNDLSNQFHVYEIEWDQNSLTWLIDGKVIYTTTRYIPQQEMFLYINVALGGVWAGNPNSSLQLPKTLEVDYVRYYKRE